MQNGKPNCHILGRSTPSRAFSLVELLVTLAIVLILSTASYIVLQSLQNSTNNKISVDVLTADIRLTQITAMLGRNLEGAPPRPTGIYFLMGSNLYILFDCPTSTACTYSATNPTNIEKQIEQRLVFTESTLPQNQILYLPYSGEVSNYEQGKDSLTITNSSSGDAHLLRINRVGSFSVLDL